jgi:hypothetical protein
MTDRAVQPEAPTDYYDPGNFDGPSYNAGFNDGEQKGRSDALRLTHERVLPEDWQARAASQERPQPPTWRQPTADEPGGRRNPSYETECGECGTRLRITNNYSPQGDFLDQSSEAVGVAQERPEDIAGDLWHQEEGWHSPGVAQERPPSRGWKTPGDPSIDGTDFPSQEWPSIDVERLHRELWAEFGEMLSDDEYASIERIVARLAGGSVASPEPRDG